MYLLDTLLWNTIFKSSAMSIVYIFISDLKNLIELCMSYGVDIERVIDRLTEVSKTSNNGNSPIKLDLDQVKSCDLTQLLKLLKLKQYNDRGYTRRDRILRLISNTREAICISELLQLIRGIEVILDSRRSPPPMYDGIIEKLRPYKIDLNERLESGNDELDVNLRERYLNELRDIVLL